eukprot:7847730-Ditylum_brightwellii.AAC.1
MKPWLDSDVVDLELNGGSRRSVMCFRGRLAGVVFALACRRVWTGIVVKRYPASWVIWGSETVARHRNGS